MLRFKKVNGADYPEWEYKKISEFTSVFSASRVHKEEWQAEGVPFWRSSDVMAFHQNRKNNMGEAFISKELYEQLSAKSGKIMKDDILITGGGSIGMPYIVPEDDSMYVKDADLLCIRKSSSHNSKYLFHFFMSEGFRKYLTEINHKGSIAHYTITQINDTNIPLPCLEEQQKIADCLSSVDAVIADYEAQVENMQNQKKGVMQKLFSQKVRFKVDDGSEYPEWQQAVLRELCCEMSDGNWIESKDQSESGIRLIQTGNIGVACFYNKEGKEKWISEETFEKLKCKEIYEGDIIASRLPAPAGRACILPNLNQRMITSKLSN